MKIVADLIENFSYSVKEFKFPVKIQVFAEERVNASVRLDVQSALLTNIEHPHISFGYVRHVTPASRDLAPLEPTSSIQIIIDVLEHDDDFDDLIPGEYRCDLKVLLLVETGEVPRLVELSSSFQATLLT
ncbi:MAG TPA: hypothetical protein VF491_12410 [Vicinamibacterales bacterium]